MKQNTQFRGQNKELGSWLEINMRAKRIVRSLCKYKRAEGSQEGLLDKRVCQGAGVSKKFFQLH